MKLVDILARELTVWPEGVACLTQSDVDREIYDALDGKKEDSVHPLKPRFDTRDAHTESSYPIVTRAQWQAAVDALNSGKEFVPYDFSGPVLDYGPKEWTGEGLPPVGTVCEIRAHKLNDWSPATIKFASRNVIVWDWEAEPALNGLCTAYAHAVEIRPIRTPEQIAAESEESAFQEMLAIASGIGISGAFVEKLCSAIARQNYRKQVAE